MVKGVIMYRAQAFLGALLLIAPALAQQPDTAQNPNTYTGHTSNRPVERTSGAGNWGLLGLLGLAGLFGLRRRETIVRGRDEHVTDQWRRAS